MTPHEWDAQSYGRVATGVQALGLEVLDRLDLRGDETVLDAGCGPGAVTQALADRLPRGRVLAVDASAAMVAAASARLGERATVWVADLLELEVAEPVDAIFSAATFHWIADHETLFARLAAALKPGGRLVAQCGGAGNIDAVRRAAAAVAAEEPYASVFAGWTGPWHFATPDATEERLLAAGFAEAHCSTQERPVAADPPAEYLRTVILGAHCERLPENLREPFVTAVAARLPDPLTVGYVRLDIDARR